MENRNEMARNLDGSKPDARSPQPDRRTSGMEGTQRDSTEGKPLEHELAVWMDIWCQATASAPVPAVNHNHARQTSCILLRETAIVASR